MQSKGSSPSRTDPSTSATAPALRTLTALEFHRAGDFTKAESLYRGILTQQPDHADALHLLGMLCHARGDAEQAEQLIRKAISVQPAQPVFHGNLGLVLAGAGKIAEAIEEHRQASVLNPDSPETLNNLGVALHASGSAAEAMESFTRAILLRPDYADAQKNLLTLLNIPPGSSMAYHALGDLMREADRPDQAIVFYRKAIGVGDATAATHNNLASLLSDRGELAEAIAAYVRALEMDPDSPDLLSNFGNALREAGQRQSAMDCYSRALSISPDHHKTHNNLGNAFCEQALWPAAIESFERALAIQPDYPEALNNLGTALEESGRRERAMECYQRALRLSPDSISAPWNIALLQLLNGDYENGWRGYEHRWRQKKQCKSFRNFKQPLLSLDAPVKDRKVLLHAEQGFGDAIQFCRYVEKVAELGAEVILECPPPLVRLLSTLRGVSAVIAHGQPLPEFELQCPLMSLPMVFSTTLRTVPAEVPYLRADPSDIAVWKERFSREPQAMRAGLVWAGQSTHQKDRQRSLQLSTFSGLSEPAGVRFYSLQVGEHSHQAKSPPAEMQLVDWTEHLHDFADTAAMISQLDLVITIDSAVAHLAGALGKRVWILIPYQPDWRWLLERADSPWYPSARLFRQSDLGDWARPLARLAAEFG